MHNTCQTDLATYRLNRPRGRLSENCPLFLTSATSRTGPMLKWSLESRRRSVVLEEQQRDLELVRRRLERCQERPNSRAWRKIRSVVTFCRLGKAGRVYSHREASRLLKLLDGSGPVDNRSSTEEVHHNNKPEHQPIDAQGFS